MGPGAGRPFAAALFLWAGAAGAGTLTVETNDGTALVTARAPQGAEWCLSWNHSVTGGHVADCFVNRAGRMVLARSYLHDFSAGLGEVEGRGGRLVSAPGGGYWLEDIDDAIEGNALTVRIGRPSTDHRLSVGGRQHRLSPRAAGQRVHLVLTPE